MTIWDIIRYSYRAVNAHRMRSVLMFLAMAIGVSAVVILTALAEGARRYVEDEFAALGKNLIIVLPGRSETTGGPPPILGETPRDLTLEDALALLRCPVIGKVAPLSFGTANISYRGRERETPILGTTAAMQAVRHLDMGAGTFLPEEDPRLASPICVLGTKIVEELFSGHNPLGEWVRIGDRRFRVIGVLASRGRSIGLDLDEMVVIPVTSALMLFDTASLFRILLEARSFELLEAGKQAVRDIITERHDGEDDITLITQDAVLSTFNRIFHTLTIGVGGIAAISLAVAGILIMNVLLVSISERTAEIGLLKALGAPRGNILAIFLAEAIFLAGIGGLAGLLVGAAGIEGIAWLYPSFPVGAPLWAPIAAFGISIASGAVFGALPANRAARLDPVLALSRR